MSEQTSQPRLDAVVHTPGPWSIDTENDVTSDAGLVAVVVGCNPKTVANARLIAAAPELAEALRILYDFQNGLPLEKYRDQWTQAMTLAETALDKAGKL